MALYPDLEIGPQPFLSLIPETPPLAILPPMPDFRAPPTRLLTGPSPPRNLSGHPTGACDIPESYSTPGHPAYNSQGFDTPPCDLAPLFLEADGDCRGSVISWHPAGHMNYHPRPCAYPRGSVTSRGRGDYEPGRVVETRQHPADPGHSPPRRRRPGISQVHRYRNRQAGRPTREYAPPPCVWRHNVTRL